MKKSLGKLVTFFFMGPAVAFPVQAATAEKSLNVDAIVGTACSVSATPMNFGAVSADIGALITGNITVTCTPGIAFGIALGSGQNYDGSNRLMADGLGHFVAYEISSVLYGPWGDAGFTYPAPQLEGWTASGSDIFLIEADIPPQSLIIPAGDYSDVVLVTVFY